MLKWCLIVVEVCETEEAVYILLVIANTTGMSHLKKK